MPITRNALENASSVYLRSAAHQPVRWFSWGEEAFAQAQSEGKPVLLDIGASWCHWCHVMDRESYENPEVADIINAHYIAIKVDRDERPDVDSRYQAAVQAISGQGGWPLTAFLTSDGRPFFGGTYFPPEDRYGRAGLKRVLTTLAEAYRDKRDELEEQAQMVMSAIHHGEAFEGRSGELSSRILRSLIASAVKQFDSVHGGFGTAPKFPHPSAMDLLLLEFSRTQEPQLRHVIELTLTKMAQGGVYDQIGGGFHRYSVDDKWIVPHFEKMSYDNAQLLKNYVTAARVLGDQLFAATAKDIIRWMDSELSDRQHGGFYGSQDADIDLDDDGDYFTWTLDEAKQALAPDLVEFARALYDIEPVGEMRHDPAKNVLFVAASEQELATRFGLSGDEVLQKIAAVKQQLAAARAQRKAPQIDRVLYVNWNALCISGYIAAGTAFPELRDSTLAFALKSLDRLLGSAWSEHDGLTHTMGTAGSRVAGQLDDYALTALACLDAFEATGEIRYFETARSIVDRMVHDLYDREQGAFFDRPRNSEDKIGALSAVRKPIQDAPTPAGNSCAAMALIRLHSLTGEERYREATERTLQAFAGVIEQFGYFASSYGLALEALLHPTERVIILGDTAAAQAMYQYASQHWRPYQSVLWLRDPHQAASLPPALREMVEPQIRDAAASALALVCTGSECKLPARTAEELSRVLVT